MTSTVRGIALERDPQFATITWVSRYGRALGFIQTADGERFDAYRLDGSGKSAALSTDGSQDGAIAILTSA